ncbi:hypothetical protein DRE_01557 [Drechslerella stenobrocha 248]|uniref:NADP-dependent oxidoreductase domain-containing protein n=1 Tax=Drechslerella stenobrocha 248 TaxID=1043628 RepID=W7I4K6_9PEZI|nr:hypothetical protein DRE_01557 [Drechslerella stenobrocha 248]
MVSDMKIVFGAMSFGREGLPTSRITSLDGAGQILDLFASRGYTDIDSARIYGGGSSEEMLGELDWQKRGLVMQTKLYPVGSTAMAAAAPSLGMPIYTHHSGEIRRGLLDSLKALKADKIDLFDLHGPDRTVDFTVTLQEVNELYKEGYFTRFGISNYAAWEVAQIWETCDRNGWIKPTVYQGVYNAITRGIELELVPCLRKYGISLYVFNPLAGGLLSGKYKRDTAEFEPGSRFDDKNGVAGKFARMRYWNDGSFDAMDRITPAAQAAGLTEAECVLRWLVHHSALSKDAGDAVILGASNLKHLASNLDDVEKGPLPEAVVKAINEGWAAAQAQGGGLFKYFH